jgi:hypothetical protein
MAGPFSLNEPGQPFRSNSGAPSVLRGEIMKIIDWLNVEKQTHKRYQPGEGKTFCNIYAHDFCHLAGVYLPRFGGHKEQLRNWRGMKLFSHYWVQLSKK